MCCRALFTAIAVLVVASSLFAQDRSFDDLPKILTPTPQTKEERDRRESLYHYVLGLMCQHERRPADALKAFQRAAELDPKTAAPHEAQVRVLLDMDRLDDAMAAAKKTVALDPDDFGTWYIIAKLHKSSVNYAEAIKAFENGLQSETLKGHPEAAQGIYLEVAGLYENTEQFAKAADAYSKAAAILEHPDQIEQAVHVSREAILAKAAETYEQIAGLYRKAKKYDDAIAALKKAQERAPSRAGRLHYVLAQVSEEAGNLPGALQSLDTYLATLPLSSDPYEMKVRLMRGAKQEDAIVPWLERVIARERFNNNLQLLLAKEYANAKQNTRAEALYIKLAAESPSSELYRGLFHLCNSEPGGMTRVLTLLDKSMAAAADKDNPPSPSALQQVKTIIGALREDGELAKGLVETAAARGVNEPPLKYDTVFFLAVLADQQRMSRQAERFYRDCLPKIVPANEPIVYSGLVRALGQQRKHDEVIKLCDAGLEKSRTTNALFFYRSSARAHAALHHYDEALKLVAQASREARGDVAFEFDLLRVSILTMAERHKDAEAECLRLLKTHERQAEAIEIRYRLSGIYSASKQQAKAETELQWILKVDPNNATVNNDLGYLWADQNHNLEEAEKMIRKALEQDRAQRRQSGSADRDNAAFVDSLGWVLYRRGKIEEARKELERAAALDGGDDPVIYDHLGDVYHTLKLHAEARRAWQQALSLYQQGVRGKDEPRVRELERKIKNAGS